MPGWLAMTLGAQGELERVVLCFAVMEVALEGFDQGGCQLEIDGN